MGDKRIKICDTVTVDDGNFPKDRFGWVVGELNIGKYDEHEGMWEIQEINGSEPDKRFRTLGRFITVWKPIRPIKK